MIKSYLEVINGTLEKMMEKDKSIVLIGEDIPVNGGCFGATTGLFDKFGKKRVIGSPMCEQSLVGVGIGAAISGLRPVVEIMFMDFMTLAYDQLFNHAGIFSYLSNGDISVPLVIRVPAGAGRGYGATHSKTLTSSLMQIPGIKIVAPSNAEEAGVLLEASIKDNNPVVFIEHKLLYSRKEEVSENPPPVPIGKAKVVKVGKDIVIISYSKTLVDCLEAAKQLEDQGISCKVVDLRTLKPLDMETIKEAVESVGKVLVVEEGYSDCGVAAEIIARINENCFYSLEAPPKRLTTLDLPISCSKEYESAVIPSVDKIVNSVNNILNE